MTDLMAANAVLMKKREENQRILQESNISDQTLTPFHGTELKVCDKHGGYESKRITMFSGGDWWTNCPECGKEKEAELEQKEKIKKEQDRKWKIQDLISRACIPERYREKSIDVLQFKTPAQSRILKAIKNYIHALVNDQTSACLILCGKPGTGKTHIGTALVMEAAKSEIRSLYISIGQLLRKVKSTYHKNSDKSEDDIYQYYGEAITFLVIDEVGVQFGTDAEKMIFFEVINRRYENMLPTVIISNLTPDELKGFIGERVMDRFKEDHGAILAFDWDSYRGNK